VKRLIEEESVTPPVILNRHPGPRLSQITSSGDERPSPELANDNIWLLSALDAQTAQRDEERA
jgi:hypothetical protein